MIKLNFKETLENLGYRLLDRGDYWQTNALFRGGDNKTAIQIYKDTGVWKDYVNQTPFMPFKKLIQATIGSTEDEMVDSLLVKNELFDNPHAKIPQPRISMEKIYKEDCLSRLLPHYSFYESRGISIETLKVFKGGLCTEGKMYQRFVFPIYNLNGKIHGFSGRDMAESKDRPKWKHIGTKTKWVFPFHISEAFIKESSEVILVESIGDVLSLYEQGVKNVLCTFGTLISPSLISILVRVNPDNIYLSLNNDRSNHNNPGLFGALKSFYKIIQVIDYNKVKICLPTKNDFGEMDDDDYHKWFSKKNLCNTDFDYSKLIESTDKMCLNQDQPKSLLSKIKKFKKEFKNE
jgi:hypothetical protein